MLNPAQYLSLICAITLVDQPNLKELTQRSYLELLDTEVRVTAEQVAAFRLEMEKEKKDEQKRLEAEEKGLKRQLEQARNKLAAMNRAEQPPTDEQTTERRRLHCAILRLERNIALKRTERERGVPIAFENRIAKAELVEHWPARKDEIQAAVASGRARLRPHGDVADIGVRNIATDQAHDIKLGQDAIREMKAYGLMPPELKDEKVQRYVEELARNIAAHSDLRIPVHVTVLLSEEINAFALPGGYLFVNTGLIERAENESELAGVIAHELSHAAARHGHRLMRKATIANIVYQAAQVAAVIFTGGAAGVGAYYALQYGFYGLGMVLELTLLGVSREFEAEADQLGIQYAWSAGYDPRGFITFFDRLAREKGYVKSVSFFRTHPPFYNRFLDTFAEIEYLPKKGAQRVDSTGYQEMKRQFASALKSSHVDSKKAPRLRRMPECEDEETKE